jgi:hypothetical protein
MKIGLIGTGGHWDKAIIKKLITQQCNVIIINSNQPADEQTIINLPPPLIIKRVNQVDTYKLPITRAERRAQKRKSK